MLNLIWTDYLKWRRQQAEGGAWKKHFLMFIKALAAPRESSVRSMCREQLPWFLQNGSHEGTQQLSLINVKMYESMFGIIKEFKQLLAHVPALCQSGNLPIHISAKACQTWRCYLFQLKLRFSASLCCLSGSAKTSPPLSLPLFFSSSLTQYGTNCMSYCCFFNTGFQMYWCACLYPPPSWIISLLLGSWGLCDSKNRESLWALLICSSLQHLTEISPAVHMLPCVSTIPCYVSWYLGSPWL